VNVAGRLGRAALLCSAAALVATGVSGVPAAGAATTDVVHFVIDTSGSMYGERITEAVAAIKATAAALPDSTALGLRSYAGSCDQSGVAPLVPIATDNDADIVAAADSLYADGGTPTTAALARGLDDVRTYESTGNKRLVLLTDGDTQCGISICDFVKGQDLADLSLTLYTVGLQVGSGAAADLQCAAEVTGGRFIEADSPEDLADALIDASGGGDRGTVVSFGDSIAAGEGSGPHAGYPNNEHAYSARIAASLGWKSYNFAISGACVATSGTGAVAGTPAECQKSIVNDQLPVARGMNLAPDLVTVTVGANDIRFSSCVEEVLGLTGTARCSGTVLNTRLQALKLNLGMALAQIRDLYGPDVPIAVTRYFSPVPGFVADPAAVCPVMPALALYKTYLEQGGRATAVAVADLPTRARDYQASVSDKVLALLGKLNKTLTDTATPYGATLVGLNFSGHDFCADYDGNDEAWVFAPVIEVFASYYGLGGRSYERSLIPAHRCVETPECDTNTKFIHETGVWKGQTWTFDLILLSNDFPHLTKPGQAAVAARIVEALGLTTT
jgi:lysophospholipase L1-like esterase